MRRWRVIATPLDVTDLRCVFKVSKTMSGSGNQAQVMIYNLAPNSENKIIKNGTRVIIEAGYMTGQYGLIFDGDAIQPLRGREDNVTKTLEIISQDGDLFLNKALSNETRAAGMTPADQIQAMVGKGDPNITLGCVSENLSQTRLPRGKVLFGQPKDILHRLAVSEEALFYINDRTINFVKPMDLPPGEVISLTPTTGLIGTPEETDDGVKARSLLNPMINLNTLVHIDTSRMKESKTLAKKLGNGIFKVVSLEHTGDTHNNDPWYTDINCIAQPGMAPILNSYNK